MSDTLIRASINFTSCWKGTVDATTSKFTWTQTIEEINVNIPIPEGTTSKQIDCTVKSNYIKVGLKGQPAIIEGELFGLVQPKETVWTIEEKRSVNLVLTKAKAHESWRSLVKGQEEADPSVLEEMNKKMMLEKFQKENPGFDFSGAEFTGQLPADPANFMNFSIKK